MTNLFFLNCFGFDVFPTKLSFHWHDMQFVHIFIFIDIHLVSHIKHCFTRLICYFLWLWLIALRSPYTKGRVLRFNSIEIIELSSQTKAMCVFVKRKKKCSTKWMFFVFVCMKKEVCIFTIIFRYFHFFQYKIFLKNS